MIPLTFDRPGRAYAAAGIVLALALSGVAAMAAPLLHAAQDEQRELEKMMRISARADTLRAWVASGELPDPEAKPEESTSGATTDLRDWLGDVAGRTGMLIDAVREAQQGEEAPTALTLEATATEETIARFLTALGRPDSPAIVLGYALQKNGYSYAVNEDEDETLAFSLRVTPLSIFREEEE